MDSVDLLCYGKTVCHFKMYDAEGEYVGRVSLPSERVEENRRVLAEDGLILVQEI